MIACPTPSKPTDNREIQMLRLASAIAGLSLFALAPLPLTAQADTQDGPDIRWITITTFEAPPGDDMEKAGQWIREVMVPMARMNPNILSYRVAGHRWGSNSRQVVIIAEYPSWEAIQAPCEACSEWIQDQVPEEGTPEREAWDDRGEAFSRVYGGHQDEIYGLNMDNFGKD